MIRRFLSTNSDLLAAAAIILLLGTAKAPEFHMPSAQGAFGHPGHGPRIIRIASECEPVKEILRELELRWGV